MKPVKHFETVSDSLGGGISLLPSREGDSPQKKHFSGGQNETVSFDADQVFVWLRKRDRHLAVRVNRLTEDEAATMKAAWHGSVSQWDYQQDHWWQWETAGRYAMEFLLAHSDRFALRVTEREASE